MLTEIFDSDCTGTDRHEYAGFLSMRQVQPGERTGGKRAVFRITGEECWRSAVFKVVQ